MTIVQMLPIQTQERPMSHEQASSRDGLTLTTTEEGKIELTEVQVSNDQLVAIAGGLNVKYTLFLPDGTPS
jgi:hypothetical protein